MPPKHYSLYCCFRNNTTKYDPYQDRCLNASKRRSPYVRGLNSLSEFTYTM